MRRILLAHGVRRMTRTGLAGGLAAICFLAAAIPASSQSRPPAPPKRGPDVLLQLSIAAATVGLAEPYKGVTTNGSVESGLFPIASTGVSTEPVRIATDRFLASLSPAAALEDAVLRQRR